jgi:hypothetical protein
MRSAMQPETPDHVECSTIHAVHRFEGAGNGIILISASLSCPSLPGTESDSVWPGAPKFGTEHGYGSS